jgi:large subunit ribosomal protein L23
MTSTHTQLTHFDIIRSPVITEKSNLVTQFNTYVLNVSMDATKPEIKDAVQSVFGVDVISVNTLVRKGKQRVFKGRRGKQKDVKKAYVRLKSGQRIDITTGV